MSRLRELQERFQTYVHQQQPGIEGLIVDAPQISVHERVEIYRQGYALRLIEILGREFSALNTLLGKSEFEALCRDYIAAYPSTHFSVRTYGRSMVTFLANRPNTDPLVIELAAFEWAFGKVIDGPDAPQLTLDEMGQIPPEAWADLRLEFHPTLQVVPLRFNTPAIWQALFTNNPEQLPVPSQETAEQPVNWLVWRFNQQAHYQPTSPEQWVMLQAVQANQPFGEICEALCDCLPVEEVAQFAGATLREWVSVGLISKVVI